MGRRGIMCQATRRLLTRFSECSARCAEGFGTSAQRALQFAENLAQAPIEDRPHRVDLLGLGDERWAKGDPVGVEAAEQSVLERPAANTHAEAGRVREPLLGR